MGYWSNSPAKTVRCPTSIYLDHLIKPVKYDDETLSFDDGSFIAFDHYLDCCEHNYADFTSLDNTGFIESNFDRIELEEFDGGFRINGFAVNCYSDQNGYYSNSLDIYYFSKVGDLLCYLEAFGTT